MQSSKKEMIRCPPSHTTSIHLKKMSERTPTNTNPETRAVLAVCVCVCNRLERVSDDELKGTGPPAMQSKVALGPDCGFGVRPAPVQPSEMELLNQEEG